MAFKIPESLPNMNIYKYLNDPQERTWSGPFSFVIGADPQFGMIGSCKFRNRKETWEPEIILTREAIQQINAMRPKPKFFLICGDMLDALPFERENLPSPKHQDRSVRDRQYKDFVRVLRELDPEIKPIFVCGNHDVGDVPTSESIAKYRTEFGPDYFTFWVGGAKFAVINSQYFYSPDAVPGETQRHLKFIEKEIADPLAKHIVVFQHIPFFGSFPEESDVYSNIPKERRLPLLEKYHKFGVRHIFCGHYHRNAGGMYKDMEQVVTASMGAGFGDDPSGYRVVHVGQDRIKHAYIKIRETTDCADFEAEFGDNINPEADCENENDNESCGKSLTIVEVGMEEEMEDVSLANRKVLTELQ